jgi:hypothetical protein
MRFVIVVNELIERLVIGWPSCEVAVPIFLVVVGTFEKLVVS